MCVLSALGSLCTLTILLALAACLRTLALFMLFSSLLCCLFCFLDSTVDAPSYQNGDEYEDEEYEKHKAENSF